MNLYSKFVANFIIIFFLLVVFEMNYAAKLWPTNLNSQLKLLSILNLLQLENIQDAQYLLIMMNLLS